MMMDLPSLRIFVAAVEERSLARAGEREHLGTSAASKRMAELESVAEGFARLLACADDNGYLASEPGGLWLQCCLLG